MSHLKGDRSTVMVQQGAVKISKLADCHYGVDAVTMLSFIDGHFHCGGRTKNTSALFIGSSGKKLFCVFAFFKLPSYVDSFYLHSVRLPSVNSLRNML